MKRILLGLGAVLILAVVTVPKLLNLKQGGGDGLALKVKVGPPNITAVGQHPFPKKAARLSTLAVQVELPLSVVATKAAEKIPKDISGAEQKSFHKNIQNGSVQYRFVPGQLALKNTNKDLAFNLPIKGSAQFAGDFNIAILSLPIQGQADLAGSVYGSITPVIAPNWVVSNEVRNPQLNLTHAMVTLGRLGTMDATQMIQNIAGPMIEREVAKMRGGTNIRGDIQKLWDRAHLYEKISDQPTGYLEFTPSTIAISSINYTNPDTLSLTLALTGAPSLTSRATNAIPSLTPLPNLTNLPERQGTRIELPIIAEFSELNKQLTNQSISRDGIAGSSISITRPELRCGTDGVIYLGMHLDADSGKFGKKMRGTVWMSAKPKLDVEQQIISFDSLAFTPETLEALPTAAVKMLDGQLISMMKKQLKIEIRDHLPNLESEIQNYIASQQLPEGLDLSVRTPNVALKEIYTVTQPSESSTSSSPAIVAIIEATADITARITSF